VHAQKSPIKFGEIPLEDLKMTIYPQDSSAGAVILAEYGEAYISVTTNYAVLNFEKHVRIKILNKDGLDYANGGILLYHQGGNEERISKFKASTYNLENGKIVETELPKTSIFKEKYNKNINEQKFTFANVKEGSVIEYSYTLVSEYLTQFPNWQFQHDIPVRHSEYWAKFPEFFIFEKYMQGYLHNYEYEVKNKNNADFQIQAHHWVLKNAPAFREEPYMTCEDDYVSKINLALSHINFPGQPVQEIMGTWSKLNTTLLESESFGKEITGNSFLKKKAEELTTGMTDPEQKTGAIFNYVRSTLEWDETKEKYADNLKKVFEVKKGSAADINLILASMLEKVDIPVDMVLLSTRDHGFVREQYPMEEQFNYTICAAQVAGKTILLDATDRFLPIGILPQRCLNGQGLVISKTRHGWIRLETKAKSKTVVSSDLALNETGELTGKINYSYDGYDAQRFRKAYLSKGEDEFLKDFLANKNWEIRKSEFQNLKEIDKSVKQIHEFIVTDNATTAGSVIYLNPYVTSQVKENLFKLEKREYPVDFGNSDEKTYMARITIPAGYAVDELPKPQVVSLPGNSARFTYNVTQTGNIINVVSMLQINKSLFLQDEYPHLREFYNHVVAKQAEQIVLKKK
jgi:hypothetical protein